MLDVRVEGQVGRFALEVAFQSAGGVTALFGHSGAGKSTVINMIAGLVRPKAGRILVAGRTLFDNTQGVDVPVHRRRMGYVFQESRLFPHLSVAGNLNYGRRWARPRPSRRRFDEVVKLLGLEGLLARRPRHLSGGEKQRVAIGRALLSEPSLLLMDEPLASLDGPRKAEILPYLQRLCAETQLPVVYVSHAIDEVIQLAQTLVVLSEGRVRAVGTVESVMARLDLRPLTGRFEAGAVLVGRVVEHDLDYALTTVALGGQSLRLPQVDLPRGAAVRVRIRGRDVSLSRRIPQESSILNLLKGIVVEVQPEAGAFAEVNLQVEGQWLNARLTRLAVDRLGLEVGEAIYAQIKAVALDRVVREREEQAAGEP
ncbi:MAG: molybdenum ABC transporter ATP-binding protein [Candidatus Competibacterales bacterium]